MLLLSLGIAQKCLANKYFKIYYLFSLFTSYFQSTNWVCIIRGLSIHICLCMYFWYSLRNFTLLAKNTYAFCSYLDTYIHTRKVDTFKLTLILSLASSTCECKNVLIAKSAKTQHIVMNNGCGALPWHFKFYILKWKIFMIS